MKKTIFLIMTTMTGLSAISQGNSHVADGLRPYATILNNETSNKEEQVIRGQIKTMETGWNARNGETFASVFADVHDYIVVNGLYFSNITRQANAGMHQNLFNGVFKNEDVKLRVDKVSFLRKDLALVTALGVRYDKSGGVPEDPTAIMTILFEKKQEEWKIISFHNHGFDNSLKTTSPVPMKVMFASWYAE